MDSLVADLDPVVFTGLVALLGSVGVVAGYARIRRPPRIDQAPISRAE